MAYINTCLYACIYVYIYTYYVVDYESYANYILNILCIFITYFLIGMLTMLKK